MRGDASRLVAEAPGLHAGGLCLYCGAPLDSQPFDESSILEAPDVGREVVVARFALPPQYCGVLEHVAQFTDAHGQAADQAQTPGIEWTLLGNGSPIHPFSRLGHILNPWGFGGFKTAVRLSDGMRLEFVVRRAAPSPAGRPQVRVVGGRLVGRVWYDRTFGEWRPGPR